MNVDQINACLLRGDVEARGVLPHLDRLARAPLVFEPDFGLAALPREPGVLLIRGPRQFGKSTWLEGRIAATVGEHGAGTALYLNGDELAGARELTEAIRRVVPSYSARAPVRRLFVDEITAVKGWERALKRLLDAGELDGVLVVTTGSKASDLRRGAERLPGRKGRLGRTEYLFTPIPYGEFVRVAGPAVGPRAVDLYLLSGGSPAALGALATEGYLPEYVVAMVRDWVLGEFASSGRARAPLFAVLEALIRFGATPVGYSKLAREAGLANNTVALGYVELLADLMCVAISHPWDTSRQLRLMRRPAKFPFINLLAAVAWHPGRLRGVEDLHGLSGPERGVLVEWLVAQELWRRRARAGEDMPEQLAHWASRRGELDFVAAPTHFVEVKLGRTSPLEYGWFSSVHPGCRLTVVGRDSFETDTVRGVTLEAFLLDEDGAFTGRSCTPRMHRRGGPRRR